MTGYKNIFPVQTDGGGGSSGGDPTPRTTLIDEVSPTVSYIGASTVGSMDSSSAWLIKRVETIGQLTEVRYAGGSSNYDKIWDNRASYTYL